MELKHGQKHLNDKTHTLLIVPYGIETIVVGSELYQLLVF